MRRNEGGIEAQNRLIKHLKRQIAEYERTISQMNEDLRKKTVYRQKNEKEYYIDIYNEKNEFLCSIPVEMFEERCVR